MTSKFRKAGVSVILPVHNAGNHLESAVGSILQQHDVDLELILIDDHSSDGAIQRLRPDSRIVQLESPARGIVSALNYGISQARFDWIARMDADDVADTKRLSTQLSYMHAHPEVDICGTKVLMIGENGAHSVAAGYSQYQKWINRLCDHESIEREFFIESPIPHPTALLRKELIHEIGGYHDTDWPEDYDLWFRALLAAKIFGKPDGIELLHWRDHPQRLSRNDERYAKQAFLRCKAHYLARYLEVRNVPQVTIWGAGKTGLKMHDYLQEEGILIDSFVDVNPSLEGRLKRGKKVFISQQNEGLWSLPSQTSFLLVAVSARGARDQIRQLLEQAGRREQEDYLLIA